MPCFALFVETGLNLFVTQMNGTEQYCRKGCNVIYSLIDCPRLSLVAVNWNHTDPCRLM